MCGVGFQEGLSDREGEEVPAESIAVGGVEEGEGDTDDKDDDKDEEDDVSDEEEEEGDSVRVEGSMGTERYCGS